MFPGINTEYITPWAGLRPMTPYMMPIVKRSKRNDNIYYNTGHGHLLAGRCLHIQHKR